MMVCINPPLSLTGLKEHARAGKKKNGQAVSNMTPRNPGYVSGKLMSGQIGLKTALIQLFYRSDKHQTFVFLVKNAFCRAFDHFRGYSSHLF